MLESRTFEIGGDEKKTGEDGLSSIVSVLGRNKLLPVQPAVVAPRHVCMLLDFAFR